MAMEWLRGLIGASDQMVPPGQPIPGAYGAPAPAYPPQAYAPPGSPGAYAPPGYPAPGAPGGYPSPGGYGPPGVPPMTAPAPAGGPAPFVPPSDPSTWGQPPHADAPAPTGWGAAPAPAPTATPVATSPGGGDARIAQLEERCALLQKDVHDIALFARALLLSLEQKGVANETDFQAALAKLEAASPK